MIIMSFLQRFSRLKVNTALCVIVFCWLILLVEKSHTLGTKLTILSEIENHLNILYAENNSAIADEFSNVKSQLLRGVFFSK